MPLILSFVARSLGLCDFYTVKAIVIIHLTFSDSEIMRKYLRNHGRQDENVGGKCSVRVGGSLILKTLQNWPSSSGNFKEANF